MKNWAALTLRYIILKGAIDLLSDHVNKGPKGVVDWSPRNRSQAWRSEERRPRTFLGDFGKLSSKHIPKARKHTFPQGDLSKSP